MLAVALELVIAIGRPAGLRELPTLRRRAVSHEALNRSMGERVRGDLHVQTVNSRPG